MAMRCINDGKFGMLQVHKSEISLRKRSGVIGRLRRCAPWRDHSQQSAGQSTDSM